MPPTIDKLVLIKTNYSSVIADAVQYDSDSIEDAVIHVESEVDNSDEEYE
jgi:hypothetical protein